MFINFAKQEQPLVVDMFGISLCRYKSNKQPRLFMEKYLLPLSISGHVAMPGMHTIEIYFPQFYFTQVDMEDPYLSF